MKMRNKIGNLLMILGAALIIAALSLFIYNRSEADAADKTAEEMTAKVIDQIHDLENEPEGNKDAQQALYDTTMTVKEIDSYEYVGYLSIPKFELKLSVMSEWNYDNLKLSPCRYTGSTKSGDLVICAHNYTKHFGYLKDMAEGDEVIFTDMDGKTWIYQVVTVETLAPTAVEEMTNSDYDLTLFTCTYGGATRVTVRCDLMNTPT
jgi:sortase A